MVFNRFNIFFLVFTRGDVVCRLMLGCDANMAAASGDVLINEFDNALDLCPRAPCVVADTRCRVLLLSTFAYHARLLAVPLDG